MIELQTLGKKMKVQKSIYNFENNIKFQIKYPLLLAQICDEL